MTDQSEPGTTAPDPQTDFESYGMTDGTMIIETMGQRSEIKYEGEQWINTAGTIAYVELDVKGDWSCVMLSKTADGYAITVPGEATQQIPVRKPGLLVRTVGMPAEFEDYYREHRRQLEREPPVPDRAWLEQQLPGLPQRSAETLRILIDTVYESLQAVMECGAQACLSRSLDEATFERALSQSLDDIEARFDGAPVSVLGLVVTLLWGLMDTLEGNVGDSTPFREITGRALMQRYGAILPGLMDEAGLR